MRLVILWLKGLCTRRSGRLLLSSLGVAITVSLLASIGAFTTYSGRTMTQAAIQGVPVDWQIQLNPGSDLKVIQDQLAKTTQYTALDVVGYANMAGLTATTGGTVQTTGPGKVLGIPSDFVRQFPNQIRQLQGSLNGVLVAQQTASNLHVTVGDVVTVQRSGLPPATVRIAGIVDLPNADSLFQAVGVPPGAAPQAPPDNVLLMPAPQWHQLFDQQAAVRPDTVVTQLHVRIAHTFSQDPVTAYTTVQQLANNFEARVAGSALVGNNLAARLGAAREDSLYARVLFLFLGLPGVVLAALLTLAVGASGATRRRRDLFLLRLRGASTAQVLRLVSAESLAIGVVGVVIGAILTLIGTRLLMTSNPTGWNSTLWLMVAAISGLGLAGVSTVIPAWTGLRRTTVTSNAAVVGRLRTHLWQRTYVDIVLLVIAGLAYWRTASMGYQLVLAPEGVAATSVHYETFIAPLCLWLGGALFSIRVGRWGLRYGRSALATIARPIAHELNGVFAASIQRQRVMLTRGIALVALAFSFATSTAVFNTTYNAQSRVDAQLTNGADVTVTGTAVAAPSTLLRQMRGVAGVTAAEPMMHRFAYVGHDLQDIYGINPNTIQQATSLSNAYFANGDAQATMQKLASTPDGILVSQETVNDYQLRLGDTLNLRLQNSASHQYQVVPFHLIGVVHEFPTAPKDSFLVANASYIARETGLAASNIVLLRTPDVQSVSAKVRQIVSTLPGVKVTDIGTTQQGISSSLTAVDLHGLSRLEMAFAILLMAGATGLVLALGLADRRRTFAILRAIGATRSQLGAFLWGEGLLIGIVGGLFGTVLGYSISSLLVKVLTGVFDPPPEHLFVPWSYCGFIVIAAVASVSSAVVFMQTVLRKPEVAVMRDF